MRGDRDASHMLLLEATRLPRLSFPRRLAVAAGSVFAVVSVVLVVAGKASSSDGFGPFRDVAVGAAGDSREEVVQFRDQTLGAMSALAVASLAALIFGVSMLFILPRQRGPSDPVTGHSARSFGIAGGGEPGKDATPPYRDIARTIQRGGSRRDAFIYVTICGLLVTLDRSLLAWGVLPVFLGSSGEVVFVSTVCTSALLATVALTPSLHMVCIRKASVPCLFTAVPVLVHALHFVLLTSPFHPVIGIYTILLIFLVLQYIRHMVLRYHEFVQEFVQRLPPSLQPRRPVHSWQPWRVVELVDTVLERGSTVRVAESTANDGAARSAESAVSSPSDSQDSVTGVRMGRHTVAGPRSTDERRGGHAETTEEHLHTLLLAGQLRMATLALFTVITHSTANSITGVTRNSLGEVGGNGGTPSPNPLSFSLFLSGSALPVILAHSLLHTRNQVATAILHAGYNSASQRREREQEAFVRYISLELRLPLGGLGRATSTLGHCLRPADKAAEAREGVGSVEGVVPGNRLHTGPSSHSARLSRSHGVGEQNRGPASLNCGAGAGAGAGGKGRHGRALMRPAAACAPTPDGGTGMGPANVPSWLPGSRTAFQPPQHTPVSTAQLDTCPRGFRDCGRRGRGGADRSALLRANAAVLEARNSLQTLAVDVEGMERILAGDMALRLRPFSPRDVVERVRDSYAASAGDAGVSIATLPLAPHLLRHAGAFRGGGGYQGRGTPAVVVGDADRISHVLSNLISNALRFTPCGGHVFVRWAVVPGVEPSAERPSRHAPQRSTHSSATTRPSIRTASKQPSSAAKQKYQQHQHQHQHQHQQSSSPVAPVDPLLSSFRLYCEVQDEGSAGAHTEQEALLRMLEAVPSDGGVLSNVPSLHRPTARDDSQQWGRARSGVGLAVSRAICSLHGGRLSGFRLGMGRGTAFWFEVTVREAPRNARPWHPNKGLDPLQDAEDLGEDSLDGFGGEESPRDEGQLGQSEKQQRVEFAPVASRTASGTDERSWVALSPASLRRAVDGGGRFDTAEQDRNRGNCMYQA